MTLPSLEKELRRAVLQSRRAAATRAPRSALPPVARAVEAKTLAVDEYAPGLATQKRRGELCTRPAAPGSISSS